MEEIQQTMLQIYQKNIIYLKNKHPLIYNKIEAFEKNLIETYHIDFINGHFELINNNNESIYNCDPFYDAQFRAKNIYNNEHVFRIIDNQKKVHSYGDIDEKIIAANFVNEYIEKIKDIDIPDDKTDKFIFIGTLLGIHLNDIDKVINSKVYLIVENSLEIFRLSLFLTDYQSLEREKIFFSINENKNSLQKTIQQFMKYKSNYNNYIRFEVASKDELNLVTDISEFITLNNKIRYPFSEYIYSLKRGLFYLNHSDNGIINTLSKKDFLKDHPILFLAAGPSLGEKITFLKSSKEKFLIVAASAVLKLLEKENITPDIIFSIDAGKSSVKHQFDVNDKNFYKDSIIIASIKTDPSVYENINNKNIFFVQTSLELLTGFGTLTGVTVGDIGLRILLQLGAYDIYLLGLDAAINQETGETHFSSYQFKGKIDLSEEKNYQNHLVTVKGNFRDEVKTTLLYKDMIDSINAIDSKLKNSSNIYNLSDGAYFDNTKPLKLINSNFDSLKNIDKKEIRKSIKNYLKTIACNELPTIDKNDMKKEQKVLKKINQSKDKVKEFNKLKKNYPNSLSIQIIDEFFSLTNPYNYFLSNNDLQINQFERIVKELEEIYVN